MRKVPTITICLAAALASAALSGCSNITASEAAANRYAIVIGVQDYPAETSDLSYPDDDANEMAALLASKGWTVVRTLLNSDAKSTNIETAIKAISAQSNFSNASSVLVYYSGHGASMNNTAYIIPYDGLIDAGYKVLVKQNDGSSVQEEYATYDSTSEENWITPATISNWLGSLSCKNKLLILDSCYSGAFVDTGSSIDASPQDSNTSTGTTEAGLLASAISNLGSLLAESVLKKGDPDVITISACGSEEASIETSTLSNGVFTYYLLQAASSGDTDGDGYVSTTEAYSYAKKMVKKNWDKYYAVWDEAFLPHISGGTGDFVLYVNN